MSCLQAVTRCFTPASTGHDKRHAHLNARVGAASDLCAPQTCAPAEAVTHSFYDPVQPRIKLSPLRRALAYGQHRCLRRHAATEPSATLYEERRTILDAHVAALDDEAVRRWAVKQSTDILFAPRRLFAAVLFPAVWMVGRNARIKLELPLDAPDMQVDPFTVVTEDHVLIDGCCVRPSCFRPHAEPVALVYVPPNASAYEAQSAAIIRLAAQLDCAVYVFNYRGIGKSCGRICSTQNAIAGTTAVLRYALARYTHLGVVGLSVGAACAAAALETLAQRKELPEAGISFFASLHSFTSLFDVMRAQIGWVGAVATVGVAKLFGLHDLQTHRICTKPGIAKTMVFVDAEHDRILGRSARLGHAMASH